MNWVTAATFDNAVAAEIAKNLLEDNGVKAMVADAETVSTNWSLSNAVGGVKLLVPSDCLARAELLLEGKKTVSDEEIAETVAASPEIAVKAAGPVEPFDDTPTDREVNSVLNATAFALLFPPLQLFTLYRTWMLRYADPPVRPRDRWKVRLAYALSLPLWCAVIVPAALIAGHFLGDPDAPIGWRNERFGIGDNVALTIDLPGPYGYELDERHTELGPAKVRAYASQEERQRFLIRIFTLPKELTPQDPATALKTFADHELRADGFKIVSSEPITVNGYPGLEVKLAAPSHGWQNKIILVDRHFVVLGADAPAEAVNGPDVARFFKSAKIGRQ